ncbi:MULTISPECIES: hypothetical protein [unclassified Ensifer]|uniref:hypothetical protein n=1 Tax=unclassified Ensifer TaxID=2633371 RepID=UPI000813C569|nr:MULTISPECIES: hypothetical protein [unclassified Ensifer]OCP04477.1 hypothetical protein BBX50_25510 [Ensifer sp. LC11]OCP04755.1 hypothetical protein BC374_25530 [Ensifer sp. LC13]OCP13338.1 hypothetical protein BC362_05330 [Ensifer sp. LC14]OCP30579.1 hypothetical protein BC364_25545 [Ensifer sp. LC499]
MTASSHIAPTPLAERSCGTCTLCCRLPDIDALAKPANAWCQHCTQGQGCRIYDARPQLCRDFLCLWRTDAALDDAWEPARARMMIYRQGPQITVLVDPDVPEIWRQAPYLSTLQGFAREGDDGQYVIVFAGDAVFRVE